MARLLAARQDEDGIAFNEGYAVTGQDEDWRWTEEWLPHAAWYLYAISLPYEVLETEKFRTVFETAWRTLYTSLGLRTLSPTVEAHPLDPWGDTMFMLRKQTTSDGGPDPG